MLSPRRPRLTVFSRTGESTRSDLRSTTPPRRQRTETPLRSAGDARPGLTLDTEKPQLVLSPPPRDLDDATPSPSPREVGLPLELEPATAATGTETEEQALLAEEQALLTELEQQGRVDASKEIEAAGAVCKPDTDLSHLGSCLAEMDQAVSELKMVSRPPEACFAVETGASWVWFTYSDTQLLHFRVLRRNTRTPRR